MKLPDKDAYKLPKLGVKHERDMTHEERMALFKNQAPDREETLRLVFQGTKLTEEQKKGVNKLYGFQLYDDDTFEWRCNIEYWGVINEILYILGLIDSAHIVEVHTEELKFGKSLIQELFCKLEQIEKKYS